MPTIGTDKFLGYSSKPDHILDNPRLGQVCTNMIINKGDLCNHPYVVDELSLTQIYQGTRLFNIHEFQLGDKIRWGITLTPKNDCLFSDLNDPSNSRAFNLNIFFPPWLGSEIRPEFNRSVSGNIFIFNDVIYFLGHFVDSNNDGQRVPRMPRFYNTFDDNARKTDVMLALTGIGHPLKVIKGDASAAGSGPFTAGSWSIACSFVYVANLQNYNQGFYQSFLSHPNDLESNAVVWEDGDVVFSGSEMTKIKVYLPQNVNTFSTYNQLEPYDSKYSDTHEVLIGVYAKETVDTVFRFIGFYRITGDVTKDGSLYYVTIDITNRASTIFSDTQYARFTQHTYRKACSQMVKFHGRIYSNKYELTFKNIRLNLGNTLQISPLFNEEYIYYWTANLDTVLSQGLAANIPNYVDENLETLIGEGGSLTGLIEFLGQLVLFTDKQTWILTDDILVGEIRKLFDIGCVNRQGGLGYAILNNVLYFVFWDGVYAYTGDGNPIKISGSIQEELDEIDRDRYSFCRLSIDPKYDLVYLTFPPGRQTTTDDLPTFIFHTKEEGAWTKLDSKNSSLIAFDKQRYMNSFESINTLGLLEDDGDDDHKQLVKWRSGTLTIRDQTRKKHWRDLKLHKLDSIHFAFRIYDILAEKSYETVAKDYVHIGITTETLSWRFQALMKQAFRINGYQLKVHLRGRR